MRWFRWFFTSPGLGAGVGTVASILTVVGVVVSACYYVIEAPSRERETVFGAWTIVTSMEGKRVDGGRSVALRQLRRSGESLSGIVLDGAILEGVDLSRARLTQGSLANVELQGCSLFECDLTKSNLTDGHYTKKCDLRSAQLSFAQMNGAVFADCAMDGANLHGVVGDARTSFNGASMRRCMISSSRLPEAIFDNVDLTDSNAVEVVFTGTSFQLSELSQMRWTSVDASGAKFQRASGRKAQFTRGTILSQARFDRSVLENSLFEHVQLRDTSFFGANLSGTVFEECDLTGADLSSARLDGVTFVRCKVGGMLLRSATGVGARAFRECAGEVAPSSAAGGGK